LFKVILNDSVTSSLYFWFHFFDAVCFGF